ncbi:hypothetical protein diail_8340, partial [Diaporthe ilicicola]
MDLANKARFNTVVRVTRSQLLDDGFLLGQVNPPPYRVIRPSARCIRSLNFLQSGRQAPVDDNGLDECIRFHLEYMNHEILDQINYIDGRDLYIGLFKDLSGALPNSEETFQVTLSTLYVFDPDFFRRITNRQFTLWLINTGEHWVSILLHVQGGQVVDYAINESGRRPFLIHLIDNRLRRLLALGGVNILPTPGQRKDVWFPTQLDGFTCGLRAYEILRVMIERINERYHLHGVDDLYDDSLWDPMSGDFQPSKVRQLMMGICACRAMKHQDYRARLSVTPRERIRGFKGPRYVRRLDAFDGLEPVQSQQ